MKRTRPTAGRRSGRSANPVAHQSAVARTLAVIQSNQPAPPPPPPPPPPPVGSALLTLDFKSGSYRRNGWRTTVDTLLVADTSTGGTFTPANIISGEGLKAVAVATGEPTADTGNRILLTSEAATDLLNGFVVVLTAKMSATASDFQAFTNIFVGLIDKTTGSMAWDVAIGAEADGLTTNNFLQLEDYADQYNRIDEIPPAATFKVAARFSDEGLVASINGQPPVDTGGTPQVNTATDVWIVLNSIVTANTGEASGIIEKIEFFPLATYAATDLSSLSA